MATADQLKNANSAVPLAMVGRGCGQASIAAPMGRQTSSPTNSVRRAELGTTSARTASTPIWASAVSYTTAT
jgi:hypothetical protein